MRAQLILAVALALCAVPVAAHAETVAAQTFTSPGTDASPTNTYNLNTCTLQVSGSGTFTVVPQGSNDAGITFPNTVTTIGGGSITSAGTYSGQIAGAAGTFFRFNVTAVSGSVTIVKTCTPQLSTAVSGAGAQALPYTSTSGRTATPASFLGAGGVYNSSPAAATSGQYVPLQTDANGYLRVNVGSGLFGPAYVYPYGGQDGNISSVLLGVGNFNLAFNGTQWDRSFYCNGTPASVAITTATTTTIVALSGSTRVHVCGYQFTVGASTTVQFAYSTSSTCASGNTNFSGAMAPATGAVLNSPPSPLAAFVLPAGDSFCIVSTGTGGIQGYVTYVQY